MSYLLGELSEAEAAQLEQQYLQDETLHQELLLAEDELIESFLRNELPLEQRRRFEVHFLASPVRRERLESARVMLQAIDTEAGLLKSPSRAAASRPDVLMSRFLAYRVPIGVVAAAILLLAVGLALVTLRLQSAKEQLRAEKASWSQQQDDLKRQLAKEQATSAGSTQPQSSGKPSGAPSGAVMDHFASVVLTQGQAREGGELKRVVLPAESQLLLLYLVLPERTNMRSYQAAIKTDEGRVLWTQTNLPLAAIEGKRSAALLLESRQLKPGDYVITLLGTKSAGQEQDLADYVLRIAKEPIGKEQ